MSHTSHRFHMSINFWLRLRHKTISWYPVTYVSQDSFQLRLPHKIAAFQLRFIDKTASICDFVTRKVVSNNECVSCQSVSTYDCFTFQPVSIFDCLTSQSVSTYDWFTCQSVSTYKCLIYQSGSNYNYVNYQTVINNECFTSLSCHSVYADASPVSQRSFKDFTVANTAFIVLKFWNEILYKCDENVQINNECTNSCPSQM